MRKMSSLLLVIMLIVGVIILVYVGQGCNFGSRQWLDAVHDGVYEADSIIIEGLSDTDITIDEPQRVKAFTSLTVLGVNTHRNTLDKYLEEQLFIIHYISDIGTTSVPIYKLSPGIINENHEHLYFLIDGNRCIAKIRGSYANLSFPDAEVSDILSELQQP